MTDPRYNALRKQQRMEWHLGIRGPNRPVAPYLKLLRGYIREGFTPPAIADAAGLSARTVELILGRDTASVKLSTARALDGLTRQRIIDTARPDALIPNVGTLRRMQALHLNAWSWAAIRDETGHNFHSRIVTPGQLVTAQSYRNAADAHRQLFGRRGPSEITAKRAARKGWHGSWAWDDDTIDNPKTRPVRMLKPRGQRPPGAFIEDVEWLAATGESVTGAARRLDLHPYILVDMLRQRGRHDLTERLRLADELEAS